MSTPSLEIKAIGHSCFLLQSGEHKLLIDPFISGNPVAKVSLTEALEWKPNAVLVSHAHSDHWGNTLDFAQAGATLIATWEIVKYASERGAAHTVGMNIGGRHQAEWGSVQLTPAWHSSSFEDGTYGGMPTGFVLEFGGLRIYFAGDTGLFGDMQLIGEQGIDLAFLPIGDSFTMGVDDAVRALTFLRPKYAIPMHFGTFPMLTGDPHDFAAKAQAAGVEVRVLQAGEQTLIK